MASYESPIGQGHECEHEASQHETDAGPDGTGAGQKAKTGHDECPPADDRAKRQSPYGQWRHAFFQILAFSVGVWHDFLLWVGTYKSLGDFQRCRLLLGVITEERGRPALRMCAWIFLPVWKRERHGLRQEA